MSPVEGAASSGGEGPAVWLRSMQNLEADLLANRKQVGDMQVRLIETEKASAKQSHEVMAQLSQVALALGELKGLCLQQDVKLEAAVADWQGTRGAPARVLQHVRAAHAPRRGK